MKAYQENIRKKLYTDNLIEDFTIWDEKEQEIFHSAADDNYQADRQLRTSRDEEDKHRLMLDDV